LPGRTAVRPVSREDAGNEVNLLVQCGGDAVDAADKRAVTSADHSHAQFAWSGHQWKRFHKRVIDTRVALKIGQTDDTSVVSKIALAR
jgi:hypothetical protein